MKKFWKKPLKKSNFLPILGNIFTKNWALSIWSPYNCETRIWIWPKKTTSLALKSPIEAEQFNVSFHLEKIVEKLFHFYVHWSQSVESSLLTVLILLRTFWWHVICLYKFHTSLWWFLFLERSVSWVQKKREREKCAPPPKRQS